MKIFKGKKRNKYIHTRDIHLDDIRAVFFPKNFYEKYHYLGAVPYGDGAISVSYTHLTLPTNREV